MDGLPTNDFEKYMVKAEITAIVLRRTACSMERDVANTWTEEGEESLALLDGQLDQALVRYARLLAQEPRVTREMVPSRYATDQDTEKRVTSKPKGRECYWCEQGVGHIHEREASESCLSDG